MLPLRVHGKMFVNCNVPTFQALLRNVMLNFMYRLMVHFHRQVGVRPGTRASNLVGRRRRTANFSNIFFNKQSFSLFVIIPLSHGRVDTVDQSVDGVCSSNLPATFHMS